MSVMKAFVAGLAAVLLALLFTGSAVQAAEPIAASVSVGDKFACAVTSAGAAECWGYNFYGQLGNGTTTSSSSPVAVSGLGSGVQAIEAGGDHACALTTGGGVKCWGHNAFGALGDGTIGDSLTPIQVSGLTSGVTAIAVGNTHSCAMTQAGGAKCWGGNGFGQLGNGGTLSQSSPVSVVSTLVPFPTALGEVVAITAGGNHTCALLTGSRVLCWGSNGNGQLGDGTTTNRPVPVQVAGFWNAVDAGSSHTCGITVDLVDPNAHTIRCWGNNSSGELGDGTNTSRTSPANAVAVGPYAVN